MISNIPSTGLFDQGRSLVFAERAHFRKEHETFAEQHVALHERASKSSRGPQETLTNANADFAENMPSATMCMHR